MLVPRTPTLPGTSPSGLGPGGTRGLSPEGCLALIARWLPWLAAGAVVASALGFAVGFLFAPTDRHHGDLYRIVYLHVPAVGVAFLIYVLVVLTAGRTLFACSRIAGMFAAALAPSGALFALLALWTGSLWGKPLTGQWWGTDARLVAVLALLALFFAMIAIYTVVEDVGLADQSAAYLALFGGVAVPALFAASAYWTGPAVDPSAHLPEMVDLPASAMLGLVLVGIGLALYGSTAVLMRLRCVILERERQSEWVTLRGAEPQ